MRPCSCAYVVRVHDDIFLGAITSIYLTYIFQMLTAAKVQHSLIVKILIDMVDVPGVKQPSVAHSMQLLSNIIALKSPLVVGINYSHCMPSLSAVELREISALAKSAGLHVTIHAGEADSRYSYCYLHAYVRVAC